TAQGARGRRGALRQPFRAARTGGGGDPLRVSNGQKLGRGRAGASTGAGFAHRFGACGLEIHRPMPIWAGLSSQNNGVPSMSSAQAATAQTMNFQAEVKQLLHLM